MSAIDRVLAELLEFDFDSERPLPPPPKLPSFELATVPPPARSR